MLYSQVQIHGKNFHDIKIQNLHPLSNSEGSMNSIKVGGKKKKKRTASYATVESSLLSHQPLSHFKCVTLKTQSV